MNQFDAPGDAHVLDESGRMSQPWQDYLQASSGWTVGDYRQSARTSLGVGWLACDGSDFSVGTYPALYKLLVDKTIGGAPGMWKLPNVPPVYPAARPAPDSPPMLTTYIRAQ